MKKMTVVQIRSDEDENEDDNEDDNDGEDGVDWFNQEEHQGPESRRPSLRNLPEK